MKKMILFPLLICCIAVAWAQAPNALNYQAVVRGTNGLPVAGGTAVILRFTILDSIATGTAVFTETVNTNANSVGIVTAAIGGTANLGAVNWGSNDKHLKVEANVAGAGFTDMGTTQLLSVPYALSSGSVSGTANQIAKFTPNGGMVGNSLITENGTSVGIGTTSPTSYVHILTGGSGNYDNLKIESPSSTVGFGMEFVTPSNTWNVGVNAGNYNDDRFSIGSGTNSRLLVMPDGTVGLGKFSGSGNAPKAKLDIRHTSSLSSPTLLLYDEGANNFSRIQFQNASGAKYWHVAGYLHNTNDSLSALSFYNSIAGDVMSLNGLGLVGIGTTTPKAKLNVVEGSTDIRLGRLSGGYSGIEAGLGAGSANYQLVNGGIYFHLRVDVAGGQNLVPVCRVNGTTSFEPSANSVTSLGSSGLRWTAVYAANGAIQTSDSRFKTNVRDLNYGLNEVMKLRPVSYDWNDDKMKIGTGHNLGFVAQELEKIVPDVVVRGVAEKDKETGVEPAIKDPYGVKYAEMIPVLTKAIQEQQQMIEQLKAEVQSLKNR